MRINQFIIRFARRSHVRVGRLRPGVGYIIRRQLREALGPDVKGLQRLVALEIADHVNDETQIGWARLEDLARWTAAGGVKSVRDMLTRLAAAGWEFRVPIGKGADGRLVYAARGHALTFRVPDFDVPARSDDRPTSEGPTAVGPNGDRPKGKGLPRSPKGPTGVAVGPTAVAEGPTGVGPLSSEPHDSSDLSSRRDDLDIHQKEDQRREDRDLDLAIVDQLRRDTGITIPATWIPNVRRAIFGGDGTPGPGIKHPPSYARKTISGEPDKRGRFLPSPEPPRVSRPQPAEPAEPGPPHQRTPEDPAAGDTAPPTREEIAAILAKARRKRETGRQEAKRDRPAPTPPDPNAKPTPDEEEHRQRQMAMLTAYQKLTAGGMDSDEAMRTVRGEGPAPPTATGDVTPA